jgi:hypothetical protein
MYALRTHAINKEKLTWFKSAGEDTALGFPVEKKCNDNTIATCTCMYLATVVVWNLVTR